MFEPRCQICGDSYHGHAGDGSGDTHNHDAHLVWPSCSVCGRVVTESDHDAGAGTDGKVFWHSVDHSPTGLAAAATTAAAAFAKEQAYHADSRTVFQQIVDEAVTTRIQPIIDKAVNDALAAHGVVTRSRPAPAPKGS